MAEEFHDGVHAGVGDGGPVQELHGLRAAEVREPFGDDGVDLLAVGDPVGAGDEPGVVDETGAAEDGDAQGLPLALVLDGEHHVLAVGGGERAVRRDRGVLRADPRRLGPAVARVVRGLAHPLGEGVEEGDLDRGRPARGGPREEGGQDAAVGVHPTGDVRDRDARARGLVG